MRPGDIVTSMSGKTIEVLNTDAEGRLILADAISYAKRNGATHIVDAATLTGAIGIALGHYNIGAFTNNQPFLERVLRAARASDEKTWPMPMDDEYKDYLKSAVADLPNIGGRYGGSLRSSRFERPRKPSRGKFRLRAPSTEPPLEDDSPPRRGASSL